MPNLVLEKGGQTFRFGLHEEKSVTRGKYITVPFNGRDYFARYGDTPTPLKIEKDGRTYSIQYEVVDFQTISESVNARQAGSKTLQVYFAKGRYKVRMRFSNTKEFEVYIDEYGNKEVVGIVSIEPNGFTKKFTLKIGNVFNEGITNVETDAYFTIERIGE